MPKIINALNALISNAIELMEPIKPMEPLARAAFAASVTQLKAESSKLKANAVLCFIAAESMQKKSVRNGWRPFL